MPPVLCSHATVVHWQAWVGAVFCFSKDRCDLKCNHLISWFLKKTPSSLLRLSFAWVWFIIAAAKVSNSKWKKKLLWLWLVSIDVVNTVIAQHMNWVDTEVVCATHCCLTTRRLWVFSSFLPQSRRACESNWLLQIVCACVCERESERIVCHSMWP